jgi:hypothetical protein
MSANRYADRKAAILRVLVECAKKRETVTYGKLGKHVGFPTTGPWNKLLDEISSDELRAGHPDITYLVVSSRSGFPKELRFKALREPTPEQKSYADSLWEEIFDFYDAA